MSRTPHHTAEWMRRCRQSADFVTARRSTTKAPGNAEGLRVQISSAQLALLQQIGDQRGDRRALG
ncbi:hypothetical protein ACC848_38290, partial [Rhizobium johnstonii]